MTKHHPEQLDGEIFLGYYSSSCDSKPKWKTTRLGHAEHHQLGNCYPCFCQAWEVKECIDESVGKLWHDDVKRDLQPMIDRGTAVI